jgi:hypothetical protein
LHFFADVADSNEVVAVTEDDKAEAELTTRPTRLDI